MATVTLDDALASVVDILNRLKPHELSDHIVVFGQWAGDRLSAPQTLSFNPHVSAYKEQAQALGVMTKNMGIYAQVSVLVKNCTLPSDRLRPACMIMAMTRGGDYKQIILDCKDQKVISSSNMREEDQMVCSAVFLAQATHRPELNVARFN